MHDIPVVILCGGRGIPVGDPPVRTPKALVRVAGEAMVCHVLRHYARAGFRRFILAAAAPLEPFAAALNASFSARSSASGELLVEIASAGCALAVLDTGASAATGDRILQVRAHLGPAEHFGVSYSDTLSNVDLALLARAHRGHERLGTLVGARVPTRFRILGMRLGETLVRGFASRPVILNDYINGGHYLFRRAVLEPPYLGGRDVGVILENEVLEALAADEQLVSFPHEGSWQYLDAERHLPLLEAIARSAHE
ncbi:MAG: NTP transferase domain-containing protein [Acidobacteriota bacterium]